MDSAEDFLTRFASGAGTLFEWKQDCNGALRAYRNDTDVIGMCPITAQYGLEYGPYFDASAVATAATGLGLSGWSREVIIYAADNAGECFAYMRSIRKRLLRIAIHAKKS